MLTVNANSDDIEITRGDDQTIRFTVTQQPSGGVQDITGWTFKFTVKESLDDSIADAKFQKTTGGGGIVLTTPASGILDVTIAAVDTQALAGRYSYDLQGIDGSGNVRTTTLALLVVRKNVSSVGVAGQASAPVVPFPGGVTAVGPIVSGIAPTYNEIIVDPNGAIGGYPTLASAIAYAKARSSISSPWTIRLLPGIYQVTATLDASSAQYLSIIGAARGSSIINRATAAGDSGPGAYDPVLNFTSSVGCRLQGLTVRHQGFSDGASKHPYALVIDEATGFRATNTRFESTFRGVSCINATLPSTNSEANENVFRGCDIVVDTTGATDAAADGIFITKQFVRLIDTNTLMASGLAGPDTIRVSGQGVVHILGGQHIRRITATLTATTTGKVLNLTPSTGLMTTFKAVGARFYQDLTPGDLNSSTSDSTCLHINSATSNTGDFDVTLDGCIVDYETGTITQARTVCGMLVEPPGGDATLGSIRLIGTSFRDCGGSGGTNRKDVMVLGAVASGNKIVKEVLQSGSRIASFGYRASIGAPAGISGSHVKTENGMNRQTNTATFATAATVAVTLPVAYPILNATQVTDYHVLIEQPNGTEVYWVTAKTNTGFTLNSSNAASTATVRWTVTR